MKKKKILSRIDKITRLDINYPGTNHLLCERKPKTPFTS